MMIVDAASASTPAWQAKTREQDQQVQSVFSEVLETAGRSGYVSAGESKGEQLTVEDVRDS